MTTKKTTAKQGGKGISARLRRRAEQIINNPKAYDAETRRTVERVLNDGDPDRLRKTIAHAQDPDVIAVLDLTGHEDEPPTSAALRRQLARDLASILRNPECPTTLYNDLADSVTELSSSLPDDFWYSPEVIWRSLNAYVEEEARRKGGR
jgi:hypothetical protein